MPAYNFAHNPRIMRVGDDQIRENFIVFFLLGEITDRYDGAHALKKIERASSVNTINQLNPRRRTKRRDWECMHVCVNVG